MGGLRFGLKARLGGEVVRTGDGVSLEWVRRCGRSRLRWRAHLAQERRALLEARRVIAISPMVQAQLAEHFNIQAPLLLNPVFARAAPAPEAAGCLLFVGHDFTRKGLDRALAVAAALDRPLHVFGRGRARPGAVFHGARPAAAWIAGAACLLHPARYEPYGNVVAEAVAAGTPVVASDATGASCLLDAEHVWSEGEGIDGLTQRVEAALTRPRPTMAPPTPAEHLAGLEALL